MEIAMPVVTYETMFLLDSNKVSSDAEGTKQQIHHLLERHGGQVVVSRPWDYNHKLSYPISKQKKGAFHIIYYTMESTHQAALERDFALAEGLILRQLTLKIDPKWHDTIMGIARDDAGNGFAVRGMQDEAGSGSSLGDGMMGLDGDHMGGGPPRESGGGGGGGRRPRRSEMADKPE
jgi:small subunit ribosomal protein S6